ncbi:hypothetical protein K437DRAFT_296604 [Tilletiaria anomala UBC 951]|uniref:Uncharacterized protein n=1 Tax=Tilletiaria anomala (strain ATCC 24038 / CBS 436.72 / UBC 951) TaxID=1037660 RepID=A0A066V704_TILAU|nr:uncharacterized protein K437DRAFT_296604 [Tilletiaria anomala UBC 951]KDN37251.1 hypothetical protein K437DRAFT_296604 [Tilletiaria anomala UBC 951]
MLWSYKASAATATAILAAFLVPAATARSIESHLDSNGVPQLVLQGGRVQDGSSTAAATKRVPVTLGVMSRCPDALYCEAFWNNVMSAPTKNIPGGSTVNTQIDLSLSFIGEPIGNNIQDAPYGVVCKHGDQECLGNIQELCVMKRLKSSKVGQRYDLSPSDAQAKWWDFVQCLNFEGLGEIGKNNALAKRCLDIVGGPHWENDGVEACIDGKEGRDLLLESVKASKKAGIKNSCTILIDSKPICTRDDNQWKNCSSGHDVSDFVHAIEVVHKRLNPRSGATGMVTSDAYQQPFFADNPSPFLTERAGPSLIKRQQQSASGGGSGILGDGGSSPPASPASVFTFVIAIALFIVVVAFVLLRIFLRNRRLRRMGLFVDDDFVRGGFLGTSTRITEDPLVPPKLWEAKIAEVRKTDSAWRGEANKNDAVYTWDALMPVAAALPPNLYPMLFDHEKATIAPAATTKAETIPASSDATTARHRFLAAPRIPRMLRRGNNEDASTQSNVHATSPVVTGTTADPDPTAVALEAAASEPTAASVNVTVLIAMPSTKTVFPSTKRLNPSVSASTLRSNLRISPTAEIPQVDEVDDDAEDSIDKGKMRRAPSLRSVRTGASVKSVAEARREAFFGEQAAKDAEAVTAGAHPTNGLDASIEEDELPELVFGTASVPIFKRIPTQTSFFGGTTETVLPVHPTRGDLLKLLEDAKSARERKAQADASRKAAESKKAAGQDSGNMVHNAATVQSIPHSPDADAQSERPVSVASSAHAALGLGDVVTRMMQANGNASNADVGHSSTHLAQSSLGPSFNISRDPAAPTDNHLLHQPSFDTLDSRYHDTQQGDCNATTQPIEVPHTSVPAP